MTAVVADTHTVIWYLRDADRLSEQATIALDSAFQANNPIYIAAISLVEVTYLVERGRIPLEAFEQLVEQLTAPSSALILVPLNLAIAQSLPALF